MAHAPAFGNNLSRRLLAAWTWLVLLFLYLPILLLIVYSFNNSSFAIAWRGFTLRWYAQIASDQPLLDAIGNSLLIGAMTTIVSVVLGTLAAWLLHRYRFAGATVANLLLITPMVIPEVIMGVSLMLLFRFLDVGFGLLTVTLAHITFCFPFVMAAVQARLAGLDPSLEEAALDLGATPLGAFFRVIVPYLLPGIVAGALLAFTLSLDEFVVTYFTYSARAVTLPVKIYSTMRAGLSPELNAVSALVVGATTAMAIGADSIRRLRKG